MPRPSDPTLEIKLVNAMLQILEVQMQNNLGRIQKKNGMAWSTDITGKPLRLLQWLLAGPDSGSRDTDSLGCKVSRNRPQRDKRTHRSHCSVLKASRLTCQRCH